MGNQYDYRQLREFINANHDRFSELNFDSSMSMQQKMNGLVEWFKVMLKEYNEWIEYLDEFKETFDSKLYSTTEDILKKWLDDGLLAEVIRLSINEEVIQARTSTSKTYNSLKERLDDSDVLKVDVTNGTIKNASDYSAVLSNNLINTNDVISFVGWTGDFSSGYNHTVGSETSIQINVPDLSVNDSYIVELTATNLGSAEPESDYFVSLGGSQRFKTYIGISSSENFKHGIVPLNTTGGLVITPRAGWNGKISNIAVKKIVEFNKKTLGIENYNGEELSSLRSDINKNLFIGSSSGRKNVSGYENTSFGSESLANIISGFWNTSIGYRSMNKLTNGSRNVGLGFLALENLTSGDRNTAIGPFSQQRNESGSGNITIGADSGWYIKDGNNSIGIGVSALGTNTNPENVIAIGESVMSKSSGGKNVVALGKYALNKNQGENNIAIGFLSQNATTTGNNNTSLGNQSLYRNTTGSGNVALGRRAMYGNKDGENNVSIGDDSMGEGAMGSNNIGIGSETLLKSTTSNNVAIGYASQRWLTTGSENVSVGNEALRNNIDGSRNVGIGTASLINTTSSKNSAYGFRSGQDLTTGEENTLLGYFAGGGLKTGSRNIIIGSNTTFGASTNDFINIGNTIYGDRSTKTTRLVKLLLPDLPTTRPTRTGEVWNDNGTLKIA